MNFEKLLEQDKIEKIEIREFDNSLIDRDIHTAKDNLEDKNYDWALSIAYNAVLQAARSLMFSLGYRPKGKNQHKTVFEFLEETEIDSELTHYFETIRKTRHIVVYDEADYVSEDSAKEVVEKVEQIVQNIRTFVQKIRTEQKSGEEGSDGQ